MDTSPGNSYQPLPASPRYPVLQRPWSRTHSRQKHCLWPLSSPQVAPNRPAARLPPHPPQGACTPVHQEMKMAFFPSCDHHVVQGPTGFRVSTSHQLQVMDVKRHLSPRSWVAEDPRHASPPGCPGMEAPLSRHHLLRPSHWKVWGRP